MRRPEYTRYIRRLINYAFLALAPQATWGFGDATHKNLPEDGILYMEFSGSNQQRWAADYIKAKAGGRYAGTCVNINYHPGNMGNDNTQCGAHGILRVGGVKPDYFRDSFWNILSGFGWGPPQVSLLSGQNFSAWYHFLNLMERNVDGKRVISNNYNWFDGYGANTLYSNLELGFDWLITTGMNNAQMSVDLNACTDSACAERSSVATGIDTNPATDYRQNGSTTPVSGGSGSQRLESQDGTNYNCFSDTAIIGACPDRGAEFDGFYQVPNVNPGGAGYDPISFFTGNEDWAIYEPAYNAATFYYNELWLEGFSSRNTSLQNGPIQGRYYTSAGAELLYFAVVNHYGADMTQITHVWPTQSYNHLDYESYASDQYGNRSIGLTNTNNWENYDDAHAYMIGRQNRYAGAVGNIHRLVIEQAFYTYHIRLRSGYDKMTTSNQGIWKNAGVWAINNSIATIALTNEKAVLDLRKCRNSSTCNEY
ncbi:MAG: hypothetical protein KF713_20210 [Turneriella sp.]|nr:hypothetical protein [Turneriella sp.]